MYKSPIELITHDIMRQFAEKVDCETYKAVTQYGIHVDKEELLKALSYDRRQYEKGYADAKAEIVRCGECIHRGTDSWCEYVDENPEFFCSRGERIDDFV